MIFEWIKQRLVRDWENHNIDLGVEGGWGLMGGCIIRDWEEENGEDDL